MGVSILALLQGIFLTQGSNRGLLHCRQILYQLRYNGSPVSHPYSELFLADEFSIDVPLVINHFQ